jgi:hypothetical protein
MNHIQNPNIFGFTFTLIDLPNQEPILHECIKINGFILFLFLFFLISKTYEDIIQIKKGGNINQVLSINLTFVSGI